MVSPRRDRREGPTAWRSGPGWPSAGSCRSVGCQVEYAGMTLPSGKYMHDDVQYFPPGPDFPWANTQAATQRARMQAMGIDTGANPALFGPAARHARLAPAGTPPPAAGALDPTQNRPDAPTNVNRDPPSRPTSRSRARRAATRRRPGPWSCAAARGRCHAPGGSAARWDVPPAGGAAPPAGNPPQ